MQTIPPDTLKAAAWRAYTPDTTEADARAAYVARTQTQPALVGRDQWGKVLAGPVEEHRNA